MCQAGSYQGIRGDEAQGSPEAREQSIFSYTKSYKPLQSVQLLQVVYNAIPVPVKTSRHDVKHCCALVDAPGKASRSTLWHLACTLVAYKI